MKWHIWDKKTNRYSVKGYSRKRAVAKAGGYARQRGKGRYTVKSSAYMQAYDLY